MSFNLNFKTKILESAAGMILIFVLIILCTGSYTGEGLFKKPEIGEQFIQPDSSKANVRIVSARMVTTTYKPSNEDFLNPERGVVKLIELKAENTTADISEIMRNERNNNHSSICQVRLRADKYIDGPLPQSVLTMIDNLYSQVRSVGAKMELRWSYTYTYPKGVDPPLPVILGHIEQLKPIWAKNADVFNFLDCGFFGPWGEQHSTSIATDPYSVRTIVSALLEAVPSNRMLTLRYNIDKRLTTGTNIPLKRFEAFNGSAKARLGNENDCFLGDGYGGADVGSYQYYLHIVPNDTLKSFESQRNFLHGDNLYVPAFGEFCSGAGVTGVQSLTELKRLHWDGIRDDWGKQYGTIKASDLQTVFRNSLGYRFQLISSTMPERVRPGSLLEVKIEIANTGFGKLFNPRKVELILRNRQDNQVWYIVASAEPRLWSPADTTSNPSVIEWNANDPGLRYTEILRGGIPAKGMPDGTYDVFLNLPDIAPSIHDNPMYSIRLANQDTWEPSTGYNSLLQSIVIDASANRQPYKGNSVFVKKGK
jgi:hypothetical protein